MKKPEALEVMHLLLIEDAFAPANLKTLYWQEGFNEDMVLHQRLKALHTEFIKSDKKTLIKEESLLPLFPGKHCICGEKGKSNEVNSIEYAKYLTKLNKLAPYGVQPVTQKLGHMIAKSYNLKGQIKEDILSEAIQNSDLYVLREFDTCLTRILENGKFTEQTVQLIHEIETELKHIKRDVEGSIYRPGYRIKNDIDRKHERARRFSEYTRYSLRNLGEALAILMPIFIIAHAEKHVDFDRFITELDIVGIITKYIEEARQKYGEYDDSKAIWKALLSNPEVFYDPQEEPENSNTCCAISAIRKDFPQIAPILYDSFYDNVG